MFKTKVMKFSLKYAFYIAYISEYNYFVS